MGKMEKQKTLTIWPIAMPSRSFAELGQTLNALSFKASSFAQSLFRRCVLTPRRRQRRKMMKISVLCDVRRGADFSFSEEVGRAELASAVGKKDTQR